MKIRNLAMHLTNGNHMKLSNNIHQLINIKFPIIQAPMLGVASPEMVAAAAEAGCLGNLPLGDLPANTCLDKIQKVKKLTDKPFAVNLFLHKIPENTAQLAKQYEKAKKALELFALENGIQVEIPAFKAANPNNTREQLEVILEEKIPIVSFTFGNLDTESIDLLKSKNVLLIGTCTSLEEAMALDKSGIDIICVQGIEAGGHRGTFLKEDNDIPKIGGISLLSSVAQTINKPIVYAGGVYNAATFSAVKTMGAQGVQVGSLLLCSQESELKPFEKKRLKKVQQTEIVLTKSFTGKYARGINNTFIHHFEESVNLLPYPYQNILTRSFRNVSREKENAELVNIWVGQSVHPYSFASTKTILENFAKSIFE